jgi:CheY-like chemotaxis protein/HPt (histidine-containing phosphotransfer) domain-containing protein
VALLEGPRCEAIRPGRQRHSTPLTRQTLPAMRVLLVEDGETNRELVSLVLTEAGATVVSAENGKTGVQLAREQPFDLILMDMQMPVMDGYTATRTLRSLGLKVPIVALTAHAMRDDVDKCLAAGCSGYLAKPVQIDRMIEAIRSAVAESSAGGGPSNPSKDRRPLTGPIVSTLPVEIPKFQRIVDDFIAKLAERMGEMHDAQAAGDWDGLARLAHWLKGSGGTVGFDCLTAPAGALEKHCKQRDAAAASRVLNELSGLVSRITPQPSEVAGGA